MPPIFGCAAAGVVFGGVVVGLGVSQADNVKEASNTTIKQIKLKLTNLFLN
jgi:hypothetical protein